MNSAVLLAKKIVIYVLQMRSKSRSASDQPISCLIQEVFQFRKLRSLYKVRIRFLKPQFLQPGRWLLHLVHAPRRGAATVIFLGIRELDALIALILNFL